MLTKQRTKPRVKDSRTPAADAISQPASGDGHGKPQPKDNGQNKAAAVSEPSKSVEIVIMPSKNTVGRKTRHVGIDKPWPRCLPFCHQTHDWNSSWGEWLPLICRLYRSRLVPNAAACKVQGQTMAMADLTARANLPREPTATLATACLKNVNRR